MSKRVIATVMLKVIGVMVMEADMKRVKVMMIYKQLNSSNWWKLGLLHRQIGIIQTCWRMRVGVVL